MSDKLAYFHGNYVLLNHYKVIFLSLENTYSNPSYHVKYTSDLLRSDCSEQSSVFLHSLYSIVGGLIQLQLI